MISRADIWCHRIALHSIFEPLIRRVGRGRYRSHLARMSISADGRRYRFRLRPGLRFHDGRPLTSADVKYTIERLSHRKKSPSSMLRIELADVVAVNDPNPLTVEIVLRRPNRLLPAVLAEIGVLPAHLYKRHGIYNARLNARPVGSGPYIPVVSPRERIVLERHDGYWGKRPAIAEIEFRAVADPARALAAVKNGEIDLLPSLYPGYYPDQVDTARLRGRLRLVRLYPYRLRVLLFNHRHPALRRARVRLALARLIDRQRLVRSRRDLAKVLSAPLWPLGGWYDRGLHPRGFSRQEAERALQAAGWIRNGPKQRLRARLGHPLKLTLIRSRRGPDAKFLDSLRGEARAAGVDLRVEPADFGFLRAQLDRGRFEIAALGLALRPGADLSPLLHSAGALNFGRYKNEAVDELLAQLRSAADPGDRRRLGRMLHRALYADPPLLVLYAPIEVMVANRRIQGIDDDGTWPRLSALRLERPATKKNKKKNEKKKGR